MTEECLCEGGQAVILPCSGGSNCGQIANAAAVDLTQQGLGHIYCLAGIAAHIAGMIDSARSAQRLLVIDGCSVACALKAVRHAGLEPTDYIDVTQEGVAKNHNFDLSPDEVKAVVAKARALLQTAQP
jgi:uncharacterized metal-binding protein